MNESKKINSFSVDIPSVILNEFLPKVALPKKSNFYTHMDEPVQKEHHLPLKIIHSLLTEDVLSWIGLDQ